MPIFSSSVFKRVSCSNRRVFRNWSSLKWSLCWKRLFLNGNTFDCPLNIGPSPTTRNRTISGCHSTKLPFFFGKSSIDRTLRYGVIIILQLCSWVGVIRASSFPISIPIDESSTRLIDFILQQQFSLIFKSRVMGDEVVDGGLLIRCLDRNKVLDAYDWSFNMSLSDRCLRYGRALSHFIVLLCMLWRINDCGIDGSRQNASQARLPQFLGKQCFAPSICRQPRHRCNCRWVIAHVLVVSLSHIYVYQIAWETDG